MKRSKSGAIVFLIFTTIAFFIIYQNSNRESQKLKKRGEFTTGVVTDMDVVLRGSGLWVRYNFNIGSKVLNSKKVLYIGNDYLNYLRNRLIGEKIPVIYDPINSSNNKILLSKNDYLYYGLQLPGSLRQIISTLDSLRFDKGSLSK